MFLVDKYSPKDIEDASFHTDILNRLQTISGDDAVPHTVFYGPEGGGKKTMIYMFLKMIYDKSVYDLNEITYGVSGSGTNETLVKVKQSNYHIVIEPNNNNSDRYLIQGVLKEYVKRMPLNVFSSKRQFKTVLINNVDNLSYYTQTSLRRMMEMYSDTCRFILWCKTLNKVIDPIVSRCLSIRVPNPTDNEIMRRAIHIASMEEMVIGIEDYRRMVKDSHGNFKICMWLLDMYRYGYDESNVYEKELKNIADKMMLTDLNNTVKIREMIYNIIITNVDEVRILKDLMDYFLDADNLSDICKMHIIEAAADTEFNLKRARREIVHLEAFIQKIVWIIRKYHKNESPKKEPVKRERKRAILVNV